MYDMVVDFSFFFNSASVFLFIMEVLKSSKYVVGYVIIVTGIPKLSRQIDDEEERRLLASFGRLIILKHWVSHLHFTRRSKSRTLIDSVVAFFALIFALGNISTVSGPFFVIGVKSDHLLLGMLVVVKLCVLRQFPITGRG